MPPDPTSNAPGAHAKGETKFKGEAKPNEAAPAKKAPGKLLLPDEILLNRKPMQERSGKAHEAAAIEVYNERLSGDYAAALKDAERRGIPANKVPKPKTYTVNDVFASVVVIDPVNGDRVGIVTTDGKKFYLQL